MSLEEEVLSQIRNKCSRMTQKEYKEELQHLIEQLEIEASAIPDQDDEDDEDE